MVKSQPELNLPRRSQRILQREPSQIGAPTINVASSGAAVVSQVLVPPPPVLSHTALFGYWLLEHPDSRVQSFLNFARFRGSRLHVEGYSSSSTGVRYDLSSGGTKEHPSIMTISIFNERDPNAPRPSWRNRSGRRQGYPSRYQRSSNGAENCLKVGGLSILLGRNPGLARLQAYLRRNTIKYKYKKVQECADGDEDNSEKCAICISAFKVEEDVRCLPCMHMFHDACINCWLFKKKKCPICQIIINDTNQEMEETRR